MTPPGAAVLVVDDEPLLRDIMSEWLEFEGYRVYTAGNGAEALPVLETQRVDVIVTDIRMPVMDGLTFLRTLKVSAGYTPAVVFVTGFTDVTPEEAFDLGAEAIIVKPFSDRELLSAVRRILTPREELWRAPSDVPGSQILKATFLTVDMARQLGRLAFGRGGFSLATSASLSEGPVRFALQFTGELLTIAGQGTVRWVRAAESRVGVEIAGLEPECLERTIRLTAGNGARSYIPRTSVPG